MGSGATKQGSIWDSGELSETTQSKKLKKDLVDLVLVSSMAPMDVKSYSSESVAARAALARPPPSLELPLVRHL